MRSHHRAPSGARNQPKSAKNKINKKLPRFKLKKNGKKAQSSNSKQNVVDHGNAQPDSIKKSPKNKPKPINERTRSNSSPRSKTSNEGTKNKSPKEPLSKTRGRSEDRKSNQNRNKSRSVSGSKGQSFSPSAKDISKSENIDSQNENKKPNDNSLESIQDLKKSPSKNSKSIDELGCALMAKKTTGKNKATNSGCSPDKNQTLKSETKGKDNTKKRKSEGDLNLDKKKLKVFDLNLPDEKLQSSPNSSPTKNKLKQLSKIKKEKLSDCESNSPNKNKEQHLERKLSEESISSETELSNKQGKSPKKSPSNKQPKLQTAQKTKSPSNKSKQNSSVNPSDSEEDSPPNSQKTSPKNKSKKSPAKKIQSFKTPDKSPIKQAKETDDDVEVLRINSTIDKVINATYDDDLDRKPMIDLSLIKKEHDDDGSFIVPKKRGRPKGSKNKKKNDATDSVLDKSKSDIDNSADEGNDTEVSEKQPKIKSEKINEKHPTDKKSPKKKVLASKVTPKKLKKTPKSESDTKPKVSKKSPNKTPLNKKLEKLKKSELKSESSESDILTKEFLKKFCHSSEEISDESSEEEWSMNKSQSSTKSASGKKNKKSIQKHHIDSDLELTDSDDILTQVMLISSFNKSVLDLSDDSDLTKRSRNKKGYYKDSDFEMGRKKPKKKVSPRKKGNEKEPEDDSDFAEKEKKKAKSPQKTSKSPHNIPKSPKKIKQDPSEADTDDDDDVELKKKERKIKKITPKKDSNTTPSSVKRKPNVNKKLKTSTKKANVKTPPSDDEESNKESDSEPDDVISYKKKSKIIKPKTLSKSPKIKKNLSRPAVKRPNARMASLNAICLMHLQNEDARTPFVSDLPKPNMQLMLKPSTIERVRSDYDDDSQDDDEFDSDEKTVNKEKIVKRKMLKTVKKEKNKIKKEKKVEISTQSNICEFRSKRMANLNASAMIAASLNVETRKRSPSSLNNSSAEEFTNVECKRQISFKSTKRGNKTITVQETTKKVKKAQSSVGQTEVEEHIIVKKKVQHQSGRVEPSDHERDETIISENSEIEHEDIMPKTLNSGGMIVESTITYITTQTHTSPQTVSVSGSSTYCISSGENKTTTVVQQVQCKSRTASCTMPTSTSSAVSGAPPTAYIPPTLHKVPEESQNLELSKADDYQKKDNYSPINALSVMEPVNSVQQMQPPIPSHQMNYENTPQHHHIHHHHHHHHTSHLHPPPQIYHHINHSHPQHYPPHPCSSPCSNVPAISHTTTGPQSPQHSPDQFSQQNSGAPLSLPPPAISGMNQTPVLNVPTSSVQQPNYGNTGMHAYPQPQVSSQHQHQPHPGNYQGHPPSSHIPLGGMSPTEHHNYPSKVAEYGMHYQTMGSPQHPSMSPGTPVDKRHNSAFTAPIPMHSPSSSHTGSSLPGNGICCPMDPKNMPTGSGKGHGGHCLPVPGHCSNYDYYGRKYPPPHHQGQHYHQPMQQQNAKLTSPQSSPKHYSQTQPMVHHNYHQHHHHPHQINPNQQPRQQHPTQQHQTPLQPRSPVHPPPCSPCKPLSPHSPQHPPPPPPPQHSLQEQQAAVHQNLQPNQQQPNPPNQPNQHQQHSSFNNYQQHGQAYNSPHRNENEQNSMPQVSSEQNYKHAYPGENKQQPHNNHANIPVSSSFNKVPTSMVDLIVPKPPMINSAKQFQNSDIRKLQKTDGNPSNLKILTTSSSTIVPTQSSAVFSNSVANSVTKTTTVTSKMPVTVPLPLNQSTPIDCRKDSVNRPKSLNTEKETNSSAKSSDVAYIYKNKSVSIEKINPLTLPKQIPQSKNELSSSPNQISKEEKIEKLPTHPTATVSPTVFPQSLAESLKTTGTTLSPVKIPSYNQMNSNKREKEKLTVKNNPVKSPSYIVPDMNQSTHVYHKENTINLVKNISNLHTNNIHHESDTSDVTIPENTLRSLTEIETAQTLCDMTLATPLVISRHEPSTSNVSSIAKNSLSASEDITLKNDDGCANKIDVYTFSDVVHSPEKFTCKVQQSGLWPKTSASSGGNKSLAVSQQDSSHQYNNSKDDSRFHEIIEIPESPPPLGICFANSPIKPVSSNEVIVHNNNMDSFDIQRDSTIPEEIIVDDDETDGRPDSPEKLTKEANTKSEKSKEIDEDEIPDKKTQPLFSPRHLVCQALPNRSKTVSSSLVRAKPFSSIATLRTQIKIEDTSKDNISSSSVSEVIKDTSTEPTLNNVDSLFIHPNSIKKDIGYPSNGMRKRERPQKQTDGLPASKKIGIADKSKFFPTVRSQNGLSHKSSLSSTEELMKPPKLNLKDSKLFNSNKMELPNAKISPFTSKIQDAPEYKPKIDLKPEYLTKIKTEKISPKQPMQCTKFYPKEMISKLIVEPPDIQLKCSPPERDTKYEDVKDKKIKNSKADGIFLGDSKGVKPTILSKAKSESMKKPLNFQKRKNSDNQTNNNNKDEGTFKGPQDIQPRSSKINNPSSLRLLTKFTKAPKQKKKSNGRKSNKSLIAYLKEKTNESDNLSIDSELPQSSASMTELSENGKQAVASKKSKSCSFPSPSPPMLRRRQSSGPNKSKAVKKPKNFPQHGWSWDSEGYDGKIWLRNDEGPLIRTCYNQMKHKCGEIIKTRDCVLLSSGKSKTDIPYVAKVAALWEDPETADMMMSILWYYRPEHSESDEIFASKHKDNLSVACIDDKCYVLTFNEYCRYRRVLRLYQENTYLSVNIVPDAEDIYERKERLPPNVRISESLLFFCRRVYDYRQKRILKNPY